MKVLAHGHGYVLKQAQDGTLRYWFAVSSDHNRAHAREVPTLAEVDAAYQDEFRYALRRLGGSVVTVKIPDLPWIADKIIEKETL